MNIKLISSYTYNIKNILCLNFLSNLKLHLPCLGGAGDRKPLSGGSPPACKSL